MYKNKTFLAIVPARGGSKRLPKKNILPLCGKPLIGWSIKAGQNSQYIDDVIVSSDSGDILTIAKQFGANAMGRPDKLSMDSASTVDVIKYVVENCEKAYDYIVLLQPTSPLRTAQHIDEAIEQLLENRNDAVISVCEMEHSPLWSNTLPKNGDMSHFLREEVLGKRSQELENYYRLNGAIYICETQKLLKEESFFLKENITAYIMDKEFSIDIDDEFDFKQAEFLFFFLQK